MDIDILVKSTESKKTPEKINIEYIYVERLKHELCHLGAHKIYS